MSSAEVGKLDDLARERVRRWLGPAGLTQGALGEKIGRNDSWVSRWLGNDFDADLDTMEKLAHAFDHSLFELLNQPVGTPIEREVIELFRAFTPEGRQIALGALRLMATPGGKRGRTPR
jgi:transcriptional regulator with XRE-family HTH domain